MRPCAAQCRRSGSVHIDVAENTRNECEEEHRVGLKLDRNCLGNLVSGGMYSFYIGPRRSGKTRPLRTPSYALWRLRVEGGLAHAVLGSGLLAPALPGLREPQDSGDGGGEIGDTGQSERIAGTVSVTHGHGGCPLLAGLRTPAGEPPVSAMGR